MASSFTTRLTTRSTARQLDFSAYNGTGKARAFLAAHFKIESEWPPCTNWDWNVDQGSYPKTVLWAGSFQVLQKPSGMEPGEVVRDTIFLLVFHEHQPVFENWSVNFEFADSAGSKTRAAPARPAAAVERPARESRSPTGSTAPKRQEGSPSRISAEQTCTGKPQGAQCWMELANVPQCHVWETYHLQAETVTWTGECSGGLAQGTGTLKRVWDSGQKTSESTGLLQDGKRQGRWVERDADGGVYEGPFVEGKMVAAGVRPNDPTTSHMAVANLESLGFETLYNDS